MYNTRQASRRSALLADENKLTEGPRAGVAKASRITTVQSGPIGHGKAVAGTGKAVREMSKALPAKNGLQERAFGTNLSNTGVQKGADKLASKGPDQIAKPKDFNSVKTSIEKMIPVYNGSKSMTASLTSTAEEVIDGINPAAEIDDDLPDIDSADRGNELAVADYVADIYKYYKKSQAENAIPANYLHDHAEINDKMRGILVDWLIEVHLKFKLMPETLFLAINLIDRFLAVSSVTRKNLQLVGVTSMLIASKYEEIWAPEVKDFVHISDNAYSKNQILAMEKLMLNTLKFNLTVPTPFVFVVRFLKAARAEKQVQDAAWFFVELSLVDYAMLKFSPSHIAAAAVYLAIGTIARNASGSAIVPQWDGSVLQRHTGLLEHQISGCVSGMIVLHQKLGTGNLKAVQKKYSASKFSAVAQLNPAALPVGDGAFQW